MQFLHLPVPYVDDGVMVGVLYVKSLIEHDGEG